MTCSYKNISYNYEKYKKVELMIQLFSGLNSYTKCHGRGRRLVLKKYVITVYFKKLTSIFETYDNSL